MRLKVQQVLIASLDTQPPTDQWCASVFLGSRKLFASTGYHFATEARNAGLAWIEAHR